MKAISTLLQLIFSRSFSTFLKKIKSHIFTIWLSSLFKKLGRNTILHYPLYTQGEKYISIGNKSGIGARGILTAWNKYQEDVFVPEIHIGDNVWIGEGCHITAINKILIGNNVLMGKYVTISDNSHGNTDLYQFSIPPFKRKLNSKGPVIINDNVWIGDKSTILPGISIGKGSVIGANSVVTKDIPDNCVAAGNPAKIIKIY